MELPNALYLGIGGIATLLAFGVFRDHYDRQWVLRGDVTANRLRLYARTMIVLWSLAALCVLSWRVAGFDLASLGFKVPSGWRAWVSFGVVGLAIAQLGFVVYRAAVSEEARENVRRKLESGARLDLIMPGSAREHRRFRWLALTAGTTEEIIFRGFLIGTLAMVLPLWVAAAVATLVFVLAHAYQGTTGMLRTIPISALLAVLFVIGGSLWPVMLLHAAADLIGGEASRLAYSKPPTS